MLWTSESIKPLSITLACPLKTLHLLKLGTLIAPVPERPCNNYYRTLLSILSSNKNPSVNDGVVSFPRKEPNSILKRGLTTSCSNDNYLYQNESTCTLRMYWVKCLHTDLDSNETKNTFSDSCISLCKMGLNFVAFSNI